MNRNGWLALTFHALFVVFMLAPIGIVCVVLIGLIGPIAEKVSTLYGSTRDALAAELSVVRRQRFATTVDELETGLSAIAAPVEGRDGVFAALGVSGPTARLQDRVDHIGRLLIEQADALSALLRRRTRPGSDRSKEGVA